jgi:hypothetical protein
VDAIAVITPSVSTATVNLIIVSAPPHCGRHETPLELQDEPPGDHSAAIRRASSLVFV